eukprot:3523513-Amphidinium_carterae.1
MRPIVNSNPDPTLCSVKERRFPHFIGTAPTAFEALLHCSTAILVEASASSSQPINPSQASLAKV